jgi:regulator of Ty1 transposition protein 109
VNGKRAIPEVSPNPFPEPVTSLETYYSHIYGSVYVNNPVPSSKAGDQDKPERDDAGKVESKPHVTVLAVRKKKKNK